MLVHCNPISLILLLHMHRYIPSVGGSENSENSKTRNIYFISNLSGEGSLDYVSRGMGVCLSVLADLILYWDQPKNVLRFLINNNKCVYNFT